jgi:hypothetical protein
MNYFSGDKFQGRKTREDRRCKCGAQPDLVHKMMDQSAGSLSGCLSANAANVAGQRTASKAASVGGLFVFLICKNFFVDFELLDQTAQSPEKREDRRD